MLSIDERFEAVDDDYMKFEKVENKRSERPDLHAWLLLDELFPNPGEDMVSGTAHNELWLDVVGEEINKLTDKQILELTRCGIRYDVECYSLAMFV